MNFSSITKQSYVIKRNKSLFCAQIPYAIKNETVHYKPSVLFFKDIKSAKHFKICTKHWTNDIINININNEIVTLKVKSSENFIELNDVFIDEINLDNSQNSDFFIKTNLNFFLVHYWSFYNMKSDNDFIVIRGENINIDYSKNPNYNERIIKYLNDML